MPLSSIGLLLLSWPPAAQSVPPLRIVCWNVESDGADPDTIAEQLHQLGDYHIFALSEVLRSDLRRYADAIGHGKPTTYRYVHSGTGHDDRLEIIFDSSRLDLLESRELFKAGLVPLNDDEWRHRSPLVAKFRDKETGRRFLLMVNHLARGNAELRTTQARGLRQWAQTQRLPIIAVGDFNFDFQFTSQTGNVAFEEFTKDDVWKWLKPDRLVDTNWADRDEDGRDDYPESMLDFVFAAQGAKQWKMTARVIVRNSDFPDNERTSDHRPVELVIE